MNHEVIPYEKFLLSIANFVGEADGNLLRRYALSMLISFRLLCQSLTDRRSILSR